MSEEIKSQLAERLPGALNVAAKSMDMTVAEFLKQMELGAIKSEEFIPRFSKALNEFADPAYRANLEKTNFQFKRLSSEFTLFKEKVWKAGLGDILNSTFRTLRHLLEAIGPLAQRVARWISIGFHLAAFPVRYLIASIADLMYYLGLTEGFKGVSDWADYVMGAVVAVGLLYGQFKLIAKILGVITGSMKLLSKSKGLLGGAIADQCGGCSTGDVGNKGKKKAPTKTTKGGTARKGLSSVSSKLKTIVGSVIGLFSTAMTKIGSALPSKLLPILKKVFGSIFGLFPSLMLHSSKVGEGSDLSDEQVKKHLKEAGVSNQDIEKYKQSVAESGLSKMLGIPSTEENLNKLKEYRSMGPMSTLSPSDKKEVKVTIGIDDGEMSKMLKVKSQEEDMEFYSNIAR